MSTSNCWSGSIGAASWRVAMTKAWTRSIEAASTPAATSARGPFSASFFVVLGFRLVDRVVEPEGQLDFAGGPGALDRAVQQGDAFDEVLLRVVVPLGLAVGRQQLLLQAFRGFATEVVPGAEPRHIKPRHGWLQQTNRAFPVQPMAWMTASSLNPGSRDCSAPSIAESPVAPCG